LTPEYAAPEQLRGDAVTTATDVYALGVLLYQLLCGCHPTAPTGGSAADALRATLDTEPTPASRCLTLTDNEAASRRASNPQRLQRTLAGDLDTIVSHALRKAPGERYATVAALAEDLRRYRNHEPVIARPDSVAYRARKFVRRHRGAVAAGVLTSLAILAGLAGTVWQAHRAQEASHQAKAERDRALAELNHAQAAQDLLSFMVSDGSDKAVTTAELLDRTQAMVEQGYASQAKARARLLLMLGSQRVILAQTDKGRAVLEQARSAAIEAHDSTLTASIDCALGQLYTLAGQFDKAKSMIDASLQLLDSRRETEVTAVTDCLSARVVLHKEANRADAAVADAREALRLEGRSGLRRDVQTVYLRAALASTLRLQGHRALAVEELRLALAELDALGRGQTASAAVLWNNLGAALSGGGQIKAATSALQTALILRRTVSGSVVDPVGLANLGFNQAQMGQLDQALQTLKLAMNQAQAAGNPLETGFVGRLLAGTLLVAGQFEAADLQLAAARRQLLPLLKPGDPTWAMLGLQAGRSALARGDAKQAQAQFAAAQEVLDRASSNHPGRFRVSIDRARAAMALGDSAAAQAFAEKALGQAQRISEGFATSDFLGEAHLLLAELAIARGQTRQAVELGNQAVVHYEASLGENAPVAVQAKALVKLWAKTV
jgi:tetratricopeptide (TPR) repeat protein